ncbi:MAG: PEP-CTERM sorting domain-containing protein [Pirellulales bacterium]|nr:PEP-CTERM sorting domain-containing protein [Pirellulales bacterium]
MMGKSKTWSCLFVCGLALTWCSGAWATTPYGSVTPGYPSLGPGLAPPSIIPGKEYSHNLDENTTGAGGVLDPLQVIAWDGSGGTMDGVDFTPGQNYLPEDEVDAIANHADFLFNQLKTDDAHLIFSVDDVFTMFTGATPGPGVLPVAGPVTLANGHMIGGAGELSYELGVYGGVNSPSDQGVWAKRHEINNSPLPRDIDGVEVWGPEPAEKADADKYSLDVDYDSFFPAGGGPVPGDAVSVWNADGTVYIEHSKIVAAVTSLLGSDLPGQQVGLINLDALMVRDVVPDDKTFQRNPNGPEAEHDQIIFSIRQIPNPLDLTGYYATGSELFVLDATGHVEFLRHGGHLWDKLYAVTNFDVYSGDDEHYGVLDINAIEGITANVVPEPSSIMLLGLAAVGLAVAFRRKR